MQLGRPRSQSQGYADFITSGLGGRVETRRWFTKFDAYSRLDRVWHALLLAITMDFLIAGDNIMELLAVDAAAGGEEEDEHQAVA